MQIIRLALIMSLSTFILSACTSAKFFAVNLPVKLGKTQIEKDIAYGDRPWQKLDIYKPEDLTPNASVIVFFYGGRWTFGTKEQYAFAADRFVQHGYIVVVPDYSKYPDVKFPTFVEDGARAMAWTADHISKYGGDPKNIFVAGHSSGAHIGALVTTDPQYLNAYNKSRNTINAFAGLAGPYDFIPEEDDLKDMFGPQSNYPNMQVSTFIDSKQSPLFLLYGDKDTTVHIRNIEMVKNAVDTRGGVLDIKEYKDADHTRMVAALSWVYNDRYTIDEDIDAFFKKHKR